MARKRKRRYYPKKKSSKVNIQKLLVLAGLGFGLYMVMKSAAPAPAAKPMVATVDGKPVPLSIVTEADLQKMMNT